MKQNERKLEREAMIVTLYRDHGLTLDQVAKSVGVSRQRVHYLIRRLGIWRPPLSRPGKKAGLDVETALQALESHRTYQGAARSLGVCETTLRAVVRIAPDRLAAIMLNRWKRRVEAQAKTLVEELQRLAMDIGCTPSSGDIKRYLKRDPSAYRRSFGSLRRAQEVAGLKPNPCTRMKPAYNYNLTPHEARDD